MKLYEVEVHLGSGGDTDSIATYLVYANDEADAEDIALQQGRSMINVTANLIRNPDAVQEIDYDGVLGPEPFRHGVDPMGPETNKGGLIGQQPY